MAITVDAYKIAYMALPKAGCSSVKEALARLDPDFTVPPEDQIDIYTWHGRFPTRRFRGFRWARYSDYWRFCVVRDPVKRLLSVYTNRVVQFGDVANSRRLRKNPKWSHLNPDPSPDEFFANLTDYKSVNSSIKHHAMGAWHFLGRDFGNYDRVYKTEELGQLAQDLSKRTGQFVAMPRGNRSDQTLTLDDLAPATIDAIRPFLEQEYEHLSAFYQNPLGSRRHEACAIPSARVS